MSEQRRPGLRSWPVRLPVILIGGLALLAACHDAPAPPRERQAAAPAPSSDWTPAPAPARPAAPLTGSGLPDARTSAAPPVAAESAEAAAQVVRTYFALIEAGRQAEARRLWEEAGKASGFAAELRRYRDYRAEVEAPGQMEGAAGSSYVAVPVRLDGRLNDGAPFRRRVEVTLRRVNDVPGSTEAQRRWRIRDIAADEGAE
jgi:hypothetical protein